VGGNGSTNAINITPSCHKIEYSNSRQCVYTQSIRAKAKGQRSLITIAIAHVFTMPRPLPNVVQSNMIQGSMYGMLLRLCNACSLES